MKCCCRSCSVRGVLGLELILDKRVAKKGNDGVARLALSAAGWQDEVRREELGVQLFHVFLEVDEVGAKEAQPLEHTHAIVEDFQWIFDRI